MFRRVLFLIPVIMTGFFLLANNSLADNSLNVVINEVAWMGTSVSANSEWLELYNNTNADINLAGWTLTAQDGTPTILLSGVIPANGYFLLERTDDDSVLELTADQIYVGALGNTGEVLELRDSDNNLIDSIDGSSGWLAGDNTDKKTMERIDPLMSGSSNWTSSNLSGGTPKAQNSVYIIPNSNPTAIAGDDQSVVVGEEVEFDGSGSTDSDGSITNYSWDFGDASSESGISSSHIYNSAGVYLTILTVTDNLGATSSDSLMVNVLAATTTTTTTTQIINPSEVVINELVSDPETGQKEWIELYNNTTSTIDLTGVIIEDGVGTIATLSGEIISNGFKVVELASSKLNNSDDKIIIKYKGQTIDQVTYGDWDDGNLADNAPLANKPNATARKINGQDSDQDNIDFTITTTPTKNSSNVIVAPAVIVPPVTGGSTGTTTPVINYSYQKSDVVINEFVSDPSDGEVEWVELYNNTVSPIDLNNWVIEDGSAKKTTLFGLISSHQFKVIESPKGSLNNAGDLIILKDASGQMIDSVAYGEWDDGNIFDNALKSDDPNSVARFRDGVDTDIDYNDFRITSSPTKGLPNIIDGFAYQEAEILESSQTETVVDYSKLIITEVLPNPIGSDMSDEFIELYNPTDQAVNLTDWQLDDTNGGSRLYKINDLIIEPYEYLAFFISDTRLALNNDTDKVRLINPAGELVDEIEYKNIKEGLAYILEKNQWQITSSPTPGEVNELEIMTIKTKTTTTASSKQLVKITGTVLVEPGVLGAQIFYIQDENIQVYSYKKDFPSLSVGDIIEVTGELSESAGERRIKTKTQNDIKVIGRQTEVLPLAITISEINESNLNRLVKIAGQIIEVKGSYVYIDDGSDEAKVYLKTSAQIDKSLFKEGQNIELVGIVSNSNTGYRILPRYDTDILVLGEVKGDQTTKIEPTNNQWSKYLIAIIIFMGLIISWLWFKQWRLGQINK